MRFDVGGGYNVRFEIIKKRLHKATTVNALQIVFFQHVAQYKIGIVQVVKLKLLVKGLEVCGYLPRFAPIVRTLKDPG